MTNSTFTLQTAEVQELNDEELGQVSGGFFWLFFAPIITFAARMTAGYLASESTAKSITAVTGSETAGQLGGAAVDLLL